MTHVETNEPIPTAKQQRETDRQDALQKYRERVPQRIDDAAGLLAMAAGALRNIYNEPDKADKASDLARQAEELLADVRIDLGGAE